MDTTSDFKPLFPDVTVSFDDIAGSQGNVFALLQTVKTAMRRQGYKEEADGFLQEAISCSRYDEVLELIRNTVWVA